MKEVKKENWKYLVVFFLMALCIGVGNYFNLRAEAGGWGIVGMAAVISIISLAALEFCKVLIYGGSWNWKRVLVGIGVAIVSSALLCVI